MFPSFIKSLAVVCLMASAAVAQTLDYPPIIQPLPAAPGDTNQPKVGKKELAPGETAVGQDYFKNQCNDCQVQQGSYRGRKYINLFGGTNLIDQINGVTVTPEPFNMDFNEGFLLGASMGRYLNPCTRVEIEGVWRNNTVEDLVLNNVATPFVGRVNNYASMLNIYREFGRGAVRPYIGAGIGFSFVKGDFLINGAAAEVDDYEFAYQGIAGINFWQTDRREFFAEYRYFANTDSDLVDGGGVLISDDFDYKSHNFTFGVRFKF